MSIKKTSIVLAAVASDYAKENPGTTASQLQQLFAISSDAANTIIRSVRSINPPADAKTVESAIEWAVKWQAGHDAIRKEFSSVGATEARRIAQAAKDIRKVIDADKIKKTEEAKAFAIKNPKVDCKAIAKKFDVSVHTLRKWRNRHQAKETRVNFKPELRTVASAPPVRRRRKLCGLIDGNWVPVERMSSRENADRYSVELV